MVDDPCAGISGICNLTREVTMTVLCNSNEADGNYLRFAVLDFRWLKIHDVVFLVASPCFVVWYFGIVPTFQRNVSLPSSGLKGEAVALKCWYAFPGLHWGVMTQNTKVQMHMGRWKDVIVMTSREWEDDENFFFFLWKMVGKRTGLSKSCYDLTCRFKYYV